MKISSRLFSLSNNLDALFIGLIGFFLIQVFSRHSGIGVSPDSVTYISSARHLVHGHGFKNFENLPTVDFPFAYPLFLAIISFISGLDPLQFGPMLNSLLFGLLIYVCGGIMNAFSNNSGWYKRIILLCVLMSPALQEVYSMLWSETAFLLLILFFIIAISKYLEKTTMKWLLISAVICAITCLTRYAGVFLVCTGLAILFFNRENAWPRRLLHSFIFGGISISLLLTNIVRNLIVAGTATGPRPRSTIGIIKILEYFGGVICDWLLLERKPALAIFLAVILLLVFLLIIFIYANRDHVAFRVEYVVAVTGLFFSLFMLYSYSITRYEQFTNRLLSPVFIPLLWSLTWWLPGFIFSLSFRMKYFTGISAMILTAVFLNIQLKADYEYYDGVRDAGIPGYQEDPFVQSEIAQYIKNNNAGFNSTYQVYSNAGDAYYFATGWPARQLPFNDFPETVRAYYHTNNNYLVWFNDLDNPDMPHLDSILQNKPMVLVKQLRDGAVYITK